MSRLGMNTKGKTEHSYWTSTGKMIFFAYLSFLQFKKYFCLIKSQISKQKLAKKKFVSVTNMAYKKLAEWYFDSIEKLIHHIYSGLISP